MAERLGFLSATQQASVNSIAMNISIKYVSPALAASAGTKKILLGDSDAVFSGR
jgi:hypothetical protein